MKKVNVIGVIAAAIVGTGVLAACGTSGPLNPPQPTSSSSTAPASSSPQPPAATGEIWQWALGKNVWSDPALQPYTRDLGRTSDTDVNVQSQGFQLTPDASGAVYSVTVYNDETALGMPYVETNFNAYRGKLPMGLTWNDTASDVSRMYGTGNQAGGYGTSITFTYLTKDEYRVEVGFMALHDQDLPGSPIHFIRVSRA